MAKEKSMRPLHGAAYMQFLRASASTSEAWPQWVKGERDTGSRTSSSENRQTTSRSESTRTASAAPVKRG